MIWPTKTPVARCANPLCQNEVVKTKKKDGSLNHNQIVYFCSKKCRKMFRGNR
jgi:hypothetical protein